jgi:hypothetical protein
MMRLIGNSRWGKAAVVVGALTISVLALGAVPAAAVSLQTKTPVSSAASTRSQTAGPTTPTTPTASAAAVPTAAAASSLSAPNAPLRPLPGVTTATPPQPHIITTFANRLGPRGTTSTGRALAVPVRTDVDGCDRNYGTPSQCVPATLPAGQTDVCAYLAKRGIKGVRVSGLDVKKLDSNRNGVACD